VDTAVCNGAVPQFEPNFPGPQMMKNIFKTLAFSAALALPSVGTAQQAPIDMDVQVNLQSHPLNTRNGGGFLANFTIDFPAGPKTYSDWLVWCIDPNREVSVPGSYSYSAYTATNFAASDLGSVNNNNITFAQMRSIISLVTTLETGWNGFSAGQRDDLQTQIWSTFRGETAPIVGNENVSMSDWVVLFGNNNNQTLLTRVPEPSDLGLLLIGFSGLAFMAVARRRRA